MISGPEAQAIKPINANDEAYPVAVSPKVISGTYNKVTYHPMIVIGCAMIKRTFLAILRSSDKFDINAMASWAALMPINLFVVSLLNARTLFVRRLSRNLL